MSAHTAVQRVSEEEMDSLAGGMSGMSGTWVGFRSNCRPLMSLRDWVKPCWMLKWATKRIPDLNSINCQIKQLLELFI